ncbi:hypothetical protein [Neisseria iguanae]|uniref:Lipoprotein n=1 Tax=Neisseria iguanae TaxID=90242 RepID=A0A2P7TY42_9NEIS|nr:hypothetical protein [Neisseria iguanae]PSJ79639.1 hypothetical protein C7N83_11025 [Neisseria iguanae]
MQKYSLLLMSLMLAACGGQSDQTAGEAQSGVPPKPVFKVKYIDETAINGLVLGTPQAGQAADGRPSVVYTIEKIGGGNQVELIGGRSNDLEMIRGKCMETDGGKNIGWPQNGICHTLFAKLVDNVAQDGVKLTDYLVSHAGLKSYSENKSGYAAVQTGRYILEADNDGAFFFRRRNY